MSTYQPSIEGRPQRERMEAYAFSADIQDLFQVPATSGLRPQAAWERGSAAARGGAARRARSFAVATRLPSQLAHPDTH